MSSPATVTVAASRFDDCAAPEANQLWQRVLSRLQLQVPPAHFDTYLRGTRGLVYDAGASVIRATVVNPFHVPWLEGKLSTVTHRVVAQLLGAPVRVEFSTAAQPVSEVDAPSARQRPVPLLGA